MICWMNRLGQSDHVLHRSGNDGMTSFGDHAFDKMDEHSYQCYRQQS